MRGETGCTVGFVGEIEKDETGGGGAKRGRVCASGVLGWFGGVDSRPAALDVVMAVGLNCW